MSNKIFLLAGCAALGVAGIVWLGYWTGALGACHDFHQGKLVTPRITLNLAVVASQIDQARGLGGCTAIPKKSGMYFPFAEKGTPTFWMKGMVMPIDIVWLADGKVLSVTPSVPPPSGNLSEELTLYHPPGPIDAVLEIEAGKAQAYGLIKGASVTLGQ